jgi:hypothetical protein
MFRAKQHLSCIISQLLSPWAPFCIFFFWFFFFFCFLLHFDFIVCALAFTFYFIFLLALFFSFLQMVCVVSISFVLCFCFTSGLHYFNFPLHYCGSPCVAWLLLIAMSLHYLAPIHCSTLALLWLLHYLTTCQVPIWLSISPCNIQHFYCSTLPCIVWFSLCGWCFPSSFCVGVSWGFKLRASKAKLV